MLNNEEKPLCFPIKAQSVIRLVETDYSTYCIHHVETRGGVINALHLYGKCRGRRGRGAFRDRLQIKPVMDFSSVNTLQQTGYGYHREEPTHRPILKPVYWAPCFIGCCTHNSQGATLFCLIPKAGNRTQPMKWKKNLRLLPVPSDSPRTRLCTSANLVITVDSMGFCPALGK